MKTETAVEGIKATPPVSMLLAHLAGYSINEWVAVAGLLYTLMLITEKLWRWNGARLAKKLRHLKRRHDDL